MPSLYPIRSCFSVTCSRLDASDRIWQPLETFAFNMFGVFSSFNGVSLGEKTNLGQFFELLFFNEYDAPNILDKALVHERIFLIFCEVFHFRNLSDIKKK